MTSAGAARETPEDVGIVLVHGIGQQRRFEHLEGEIRDLIAAMKQRPGADVYVEVLSGPGAGFHAEQATWHGGPEGVIRVTVREPGRLTVRFHVHEVWWADVNEPYSLAKQFRFWLWGLSVWNYPASRNTTLPSAGAVKYPVAMPKGRRSATLDVRVRLFGVAVVFLLGSSTIGVATLLAKRLLGLEAPNLVQTFVNYVSAVKLYNQRGRGRGWFASGGDFLDTLGNPPRVSIRRRMIQTLADVARQGYSRWYVLGHSQGSVVAFNGLMESAWAWPGYLDEARWQALTACGMAGPPPEGWKFQPQDPTAETMPPRPPWVENAIVYRNELFAGFRGLLTYGSPIGKFAAIWPARVPIAREPAFPVDAEWINIFDPLDPVSGPLRDYATGRNPDLAAGACPPLASVGYASSDILLVGHIQYFAQNRAGGSLADGVAAWLLSGRSGRVTGKSEVDETPRGSRFFEVDDKRMRRRMVGTYVSWVAVLVAVVILLEFALRLVFGLGASWGIVGWLGGGVVMLLGAASVALSCGVVANKAGMFGDGDSKKTARRDTSCPDP